MTHDQRVDRLVYLMTNAAEAFHSIANSCLTSTGSLEGLQDAREVMLLLSQNPPDYVAAANIVSKASISNPKWHKFYHKVKEFFETVRNLRTDT